MSKRPHIKTNSQALRWCKTRKAHVEFDNWCARGVSASPQGTCCRIKLGTKKKFYVRKTLIQTVNAWIDHFNKEE